MFFTSSGSMNEGVFVQEGMLLYQGLRLFSGKWKRGFTSTEGVELVGSKFKSPSELLQLFLLRRQTGVRMLPPSVDRPKGALEFRRLQGDSPSVTTVSIPERFTVGKDKHGLTTDVWRMINDPDLRTYNVHVPITTSCRFVEYVRLQNRSTSLPVTASYGPLETWYEPNAYRWELYKSHENEFGMLEDFLTIQGMVGLMYCGGGKIIDQRSSDHTEFVGFFEHMGGPKYANCLQVPFSLESSWVMNHFDRFVVLAKLNPNKMLDLRKIVSNDIGRRSMSLKKQGWDNTPGPLDNPKFKYWDERPDDLLCLLQSNSVVGNLHSVKRIDGLRQRFFGLFNHAIVDISKTWMQLPEWWLRKFLKPKCLSDLYEVADSHTSISVWETGSAAPGSTSNSCLKDCFIQLVPPSEAAVLEELDSWVPPQNLRTGLAKVFKLSILSYNFNYYIKKLTQEDRERVFSAEPTLVDQNIIIRPETNTGTTVPIRILSLPIHTVHVTTKLSNAYVRHRLGISRVSHQENPSRKHDLRTDGQGNASPCPRCVRNQKLQGGLLHPHRSKKVIPFWVSALLGT
jgi:hypothetical protein